MFKQWILARLLDSWLCQDACCILWRQEACLTLLNSTWCDSHWLDSDKVNWPCIVQKNKMLLASSRIFSHLLAMCWSGGSERLWTTLTTLRHFDTTLYLQLLWIQGRFHDRALGFQGTRATSFDYGRVLGLKSLLVVRCNQVSKFVCDSMPSQPNCYSRKHAKKSFVAAAGQYCLATVDLTPQMKHLSRSITSWWRFWRGQNSVEK